MILDERADSGLAKIESRNIEFLETYFSSRVELRSLSELYVVNSVQFPDESWELNPQNDINYIMIGKGNGRDYRIVGAITFR